MHQKPSPRVTKSTSETGPPKKDTWLGECTLLADCLVTFSHFDRCHRPPKTPAETGRIHDRNDYFGIRSPVAALHVRAISLLVIVPLVHSRADRRLKARSAGQLVELG